MPVMPTQGQSIIVDTPEQAQATQQLPRIQPGARLVSWIVGKVKQWEEHRDRGYARKWGEYWRMWRGQWDKDDQNRQSERSRLIAPALAQAIEMNVAEIEEALFSREVWFDIADDYQDQEREDALVARDMLLEDFDKVNVQDAVTEAVTNAAIFGTGLVKINVFVSREDKPERHGQTYELVRAGAARVYVTVESIRPDEFVPDPSGRTIEEMLGMAHVIPTKPLHSVLERIEEGVFREDALLFLMPQRRMKNVDVDQTDPQSDVTQHADHVSIIEYHGKVPLKFFEELTEKRTLLDEVLAADIRETTSDEEDGQLIEAIVTIANESVLLRAMPNPFVMQDRAIVAFPWEKVPGRFWGRGVAEKGYNPQKALDAEIRARIDALGFVSAPMLGVDSGRVPKGFKLEVRPGKVWLTQGPPADVLQPVQIGDINANTFNQAAEMERMVQMGTGAFDTASALGRQSESGANSLSSNSMMMGAFVKRSKRAIRNIDRHLLKPMIQKSMWRYMQFDPQRYPSDYEFHVKATMGIIAREVEAMQMTQLIGMLPEEAKSVTLTIAQGIIEHSTFANKAQILQQINEALQPPPPEVQEQQRQLADMQLQAAIATAQGAILANQKVLSEIRLNLAKAQREMRSADVEDDKLVQEQMRIENETREIEQFAQQNKIALERLELQRDTLQLKKQELQKKAKEPSSK